MWSHHIWMLLFFANLPQIERQDKLTRVYISLSTYDTSVETFENKLQTLRHITSIYYSKYLYSRNTIITTKKFNFDICS